MNLLSICGIILITIAIIEIILSGTWNKMYFSYGIPILSKEIEFSDTNKTSTEILYFINHMDTVKGFSKYTGRILDENIASNISIAPNTTQSYIISFTLHGTGSEQNEDQGKTFKGYHFPERTFHAHEGTAGQSGAAGFLEQSIGTVRRGSGRARQVRGG